MRLDVGHVVFALVIGFVGFWVGRNVDMPGDEG
jgi:hypothetical protein